MCTNGNKPCFHFYVTMCSNNASVPILATVCFNNYPGSCWMPDSKEKARQTDKSKHRRYSSIALEREEGNLKAIVVSKSHERNHTAASYFKDPWLRRRDVASCSMSAIRYRCYQIFICSSHACGRKIKRSVYRSEQTRSVVIVKRTSNQNKSKHSPSMKVSHDGTL